MFVSVRPMFGVHAQVFLFLGGFLKYSFGSILAFIDCGPIWVEYFFHLVEPWPQAPPFLKEQHSFSTNRVGSDIFFGLVTQWPHVFSSETV